MTNGTADAAPQKRGPALLAVGAIGVVFGDIGTSPLYAIQQIFHDSPHFATDHAAILGALSLIVWSLLFVVCVKYVGLVLGAAHDGEGGTLAMLGLIHAHTHPGQDDGRDRHDAVDRRRIRLPGALTLLVLFASALLLGDGMVTPAISVLSAVEGLEVGTSALKPVVLPVSLAILLALFLLQSRGTERVGRLFGPVMMVWFGTIAALGAVGIARHPAVLAALDPVLGLRFLTHHGWEGYATLGSVVLAFSGVEALYADLGQFGRTPITLAWYAVVLPALMLDYFGQGASLLADPHGAANPFFALVPHALVYPVVGIATLAAIIASQALISGAFSLARQAVGMGYIPRYRVVHTSPGERGQVYMPAVNIVLAIGCSAIVLGFRSSDALGAAYGLAVIGTMTITSIAFSVVMRRVWQWPWLAVVPITALFLTVEGAFLGANLAKIVSGAWLPLAIASVAFLFIAAWTLGRARFHQALEDWAMPLDAFRAACRGHANADDTVVFLSRDYDRVPLVGHSEYLRERAEAARVVLLRVLTEDAPYVDGAERLSVETLEPTLLRARLRYGFMQAPNLIADLAPFADLKVEEALFFLPTPVLTAAGTWAQRLRRQAFMFFGNTGLSPIEYFGIAPDHALMIGFPLKT